MRRRFSTWLKSQLTAPPVRIAVGTDLVWVPDVADSIARFGARYLERVFTPAEILYTSARPTTVRHLSLAARFAAKEATMKVLGPTSADALPWQSIEVIKEPNGALTLALHEPAATLARAAGIEQLSLSVSHDHDYATAVVIALRRP